LLLLCASLAISVRLVWILHGRPETSLNVLAYTFAPAIGCLFARQVSLFILLGLVLFLYWHQSRPFLAGASLWLCLLKPHLFLPFGLVLLLWMVKNRSYKILAGTLSALAVSSIIVTLFDPMVWSHYIQMAKVQTVMDLQIPCISIMLRRFIKPHTLWIEYLPVLLASIWAIDYFRRHREDWDWLKHGSLLVLISLVAAPYSWFPDQAIAIPAILHGVYATRSRYLLMALALASAVFQVGIIRGVDFFHSPHYIWTGPAWVIWYLCAVHKKDAPAIHPSVDPNPRAAAVAS
jgi:hypothetical protein